MYLRALAAVLLIALVALCSPAAAAGGLRVDESATVVRFVEGQAQTSLALVNDGAAPATLRVTVELLDPDDHVVAEVRRREVVRAGPSTLRLSAPFAVDAIAADDLGWHRLRYRLVPENAPATEGVVSVSRISPDLFELGVVTSRRARAGGTVAVRVLARHPFTGRPAGGVRVAARVATDDEEAAPAAAAAGVTGADGVASLALDLPRDGGGDVKISVVGRKGGFVREKSEYVDVDEARRILLSSDKLLYQPGQTLHLRVLVFDAARRAVPGAEVTFTVEDPEGKVTFSAAAATDRFGVASSNWTIPDATRLGDYFIRAETDEDGDAEQTVRISRYELPTFTVNATPDRPYYLEGQNARIEVRADYLFGRPVTRGRARLVVERDRRWDYRQQKWVTNEGAAFDGELDAEGRFVAEIDLAEAHDRLSSETYERILDVRVAAYVTDSSTNRTEQRRVDLRVTREEIHLYVADESLGQRRGFPARFYVSSFYADGRPAPCRVEVRATGPEGAGGALLATVTTNAHGLARVEGFPMPAAPDAGENVALVLEARDGAGRAGRHVEDFWDHGVHVLRLGTDRAILRPGEPLRVEISSSLSDAGVHFDLRSASGDVLHSAFVRLANGRGSLVVPYAPSFRGEITLSAWAQTPPDDDSPEDDAVAVARGVVYPDTSELSVAVTPSRDDYRPGERAEVAFELKGRDGRSAEGVLGVKVVDRAVEERERTHLEFGRRGAVDEYASLWRRDEWIAGVSRASLTQLDPREQPSDDMQLVAEVLLRESRFDATMELPYGAGSPRDVFEKLAARLVAPVAAAVEACLATDGAVPTDEASLRTALASRGVDPDGARDPWGTLLTPTFAVRGTQDEVAWTSAGPDERHGTSDDFTAYAIQRPWFSRTGRAIDLALVEHARRTGRYARDAAGLREALEAAGLGDVALRDRWGRPLVATFSAGGLYYVTWLHTAGADGLLDGRDDETVWTSYVSFADVLQARARDIFAAFAVARGRLPETDAELREAGLAGASLRDGWGRALYAEFGWTPAPAAAPQLIQGWADTGAGRAVAAVRLRSVGRDGVRGTGDDFDVAAFTRWELLAPRRAATVRTIQGAAGIGGGAVRGVVTDQTGAAIQHATVIAINERSEREFAARTDAEGQYLIANLPAGVYSVRCESPGFMTGQRSELRVGSMKVFEVDFELWVAAAGAMVDVTASDEPVVDVTSTKIATVVRDEIVNVRMASASAGALSTPRVREYFPETLVWEPSLETDARGRARLVFPLADSITTWKLTAVASTEDGRLGEATREILAFQPFFVDHDPPKVLTVGDEISLPVALRSYLDRPQAVDVTMAPAPWFESIGPAGARSQVRPNEPAREIFRFRAVAPVDAGPQRVLAVGAAASDAVERPVRVRPDGRELAATAGAVVGGAATLELPLPARPLAGTLRGEVKVYPNLMAHVIESIEGILARPHGCGEQTISSSYPSVVVLRAYGETGDGPLAARARGYARAGYARLLGYRGADGGFTYWGRGDSDLALTAYAVKFLSDAGAVIETDSDALAGARAWLLGRQHADGSWGGPGLTAYVVRALAEAERAGASGAPTTAPLAAALRRALAWLDEHPNRLADPYALASYALAAQAMGDAVRAGAATGRLVRAATTENGRTVWKAGGTTPFHGWGRAADVETTALATRSLLRSGDTLLARAGLYSLLNDKDRYGVWYSTQTTVNVIDALLAAPSAGATAGDAEVWVNGERAGALRLSASAGPIGVDVSDRLAPGANRVEVRLAGDDWGLTTAQVVAACYVPWDAAEAAAAPASSPRLDVRYDRTRLAVGERVGVRVRAGRGEAAGGGMLLAEVGLPPGAEVDRESLRSAAATGAVDRYDVLPDRVVLYVWPPWGRDVVVDFAFQFRYPVDAQTAPSQIYDYYNPEAARVLAPTRFVVTEGAED